MRIEQFGKNQSNGGELEMWFTCSFSDYENTTYIYYFIINFLI
jgi:hypothetical protein